MKICHIINNFKAGGAQSLVKNLSLSQIENNVVTIVSIEKIDDEYSSALKEIFMNNNNTVIELNKQRHNKLSFLKSLILLFNYLSKGKFDIINTHLELSHIYAGLYKFIFFLRKKETHVLTIHNGPEKWSNICSILNYKKPSVFCSEAAFLLNKKRNCPSEIIDNGIIVKENIDLESSFKKDFYNQHNIPKNSKTVISIGSLRKQKNYEFLISLVNKYYENSQIHFLVCGGSYGGPDYISPEAFKDVKNIHYLGICNNAEQLIQMSDVFLSCSIFEGLPISVLEAFFAGTVCVLSPIDQHINIGKGVPFCYIPEKFHYEEFKNKIDTALELIISKRDILKTRNETIEKYNIKYTTRKYHLFYQKLKSNTNENFLRHPNL